MKMRLLELKDDDKKTKKFRVEELSEGWKDIEQVLYYQGFSYISKIIYLELINRHHSNFFASDFDIEKIWELIAKKYYLLILQ